MAQCACPGCHARLQMPETMAGKQVRCPKCKAPFVVAAAAAPKTGPAKTAPAKSPPRPASSAPKSEAVTARARPSATFSPAKKSAAGPRSRKRDDDDDDFDDVEPVRSKSRKHAKEKPSEFPWLLVSLLGGGAVLLLFGVVGGIFLCSDVFRQVRKTCYRGSTMEMTRRDAVASFALFAELIASGRYAEAEPQTAPQQPAPQSLARFLGLSPG